VLPHIEGRDAYWAIKQRARKQGRLSEEPGCTDIEMPRNSPTGFICAFFATLMGSGAGVELSWKTGSANAMLHASERALTPMIVFATSVAAIVGSTQWLPGRRIARAPRLLGLLLSRSIIFTIRLGLTYPDSRQQRGSLAAGWQRRSSYCDFRRIETPPVIERR
jgi:hypothetical protein